jgi:hypothetical protein
MPFGISTSGGGRTGFGTVPSPINLPPNLFTQLGQVPGFSGNTTGTGNVISSQLAGTVSPMTLNALKTGAAQFGVASGMPGSGLETNQLFGNIAGFSEGQQQKGVQNYLAQVGALGPTMTSPGLAAEIAAHNADLAAAPDPKLAAQEQFNQWLKGFQYTSGAGGYGNVGRWPGGGTLGPAPYGATIGRTYAGAGGVLPGTDALGFPSYDMSSQQGYGTAVATASPPPGGWPGASAPWNAGFATGPRSNLFSGFPDLGGFYPGISDEEAIAAGGG